MLSLADDDPDAVDGSGGRSHFVTAHLAHCPSCREMAERVRGVEAKLDDLSSRSPSQLQVQNILNRGLAAMRDAHPAEVEAIEASEDAVEAGWRTRLVRRVLYPRPGRFGAAKFRLQPWQAIAATFLVVVMAGGYFAHRRFNLSGQAAVIPAAEREEQPWVRVPSLGEMGVSERLSEWQMKARSPFEKINGWKGPLRRLDDADLNIEWGSASATVLPQPLSSDEESLSETNDAKVAARRSVSPPSGEVAPKPPAPVDSTTPAVLSKGFKDTR